MKGAHSGMEIIQAILIFNLVAGLRISFSTVHAHMSRVSWSWSGSLSPLQDCPTLQIFITSTLDKVLYYGR